MLLLLCIENIHALLFIMLKLVVVIQELWYSVGHRTFVFNLCSVSWSIGMTLFLASEVVWGLLGLGVFGWAQVAGMLM